MRIKNKKSPCLLLMLILSLLLYACSGEDSIKDLHGYMAALKKAVIKHKKTDYVAKLHFPVPVVFQTTGKQRDPFVEEEASYTSGSISQPLTAYPTKRYEFIGTVSRNGQVWAIIKAPDNKIYQLTKNNQIGNHYGKIKAIYPDHLEVEEEVPGEEGTTGAKRVIKNIVNLHLKSRS